MVKDASTGLWVRPDTNDAWIVKEGATSYAHLDLGAQSVVLDLGAHIGSFARYAVGKGAKRVVCFEPHPDNYRLLVKNCRGIAYELHNTAIAETAGNLQLYVSKTEKGTAMHRTCPVRGRAAIDVKSEALSKVISAKKPSILKVDVEGAEIDLFHSIKLPSYVKQIAMEVHWTFKPEYRHSAQEMLENLLAQGFDYGSKRRLAFTDWNPVITLKR